MMNLCRGQWQEIDTGLAIDEHRMVCFEEGMLCTLEVGWLSGRPVCCWREAIAEPLQASIFALHAAQATVALVSEEQANEQKDESPFWDVYRASRLVDFEVPSLAAHALLWIVEVACVLRYCLFQVKEQIEGDNQVRNPKKERMAYTLATGRLEHSYLSEMPALSHSNFSLSVAQAVESARMRRLFVRT